MIYLFSFLIVMFNAIGNSARAESKNAKIEVAGVGEVRIQFSEVGEPISQPERVEVTATCKGSKKSKVLAVYRMCTYEGHVYEKGTKTLTLKMYYGRID